MMVKTQSVYHSVSITQEGNVTMRNLVFHIFAFILALSTASAEDSVLQISAFNVRIFGKTKASKQEVMDKLVLIVRKYDIILIQEIRDISGNAIQQLLQQVNEKGTQQYEMEISERLGRSSSKEQYAFLYRKNVGISVVQTYQFPDPQDVFEREPYAVKFHVGDSKIPEIVLVGIHADPDDAVEEIDALDDVHKQIQQQMGTENILILGDLNADCSYVGQAAKQKLILRNDPKYHWLIEDEIDTTVTGTDCAYDRFILTGNNFLESIIPGSADVFRFDLEYNLNQKQAEDISDHYPIQLKMNIQTFRYLSNMEPQSTQSSSGSSAMLNCMDTLISTIEELWLRFVDCMS